MRTALADGLEQETGSPTAAAAGTCAAGTCAAADETQRASARVRLDLASIEHRHNMCVESVWTQESTFLLQRESFSAICADCGLSAPVSDVCLKLEDSGKTGRHHLPFSLLLVYNLFRHFALHDNKTPCRLSSTQGVLKCTKALASGVAKPLAHRTDFGHAQSREQFRDKSVSHGKLHTHGWADVLPPLPGKVFERVTIAPRSITVWKAWLRPRQLARHAQTFALSFKTTRAYILEMASLLPSGVS